MSERSRGVAALCSAVLVAAMGCASVPQAPGPQGDAAIASALLSTLDRYGIPSMAAAVVTSRGLQSVAAAGVRKQGSPERVTLGDLWHLGSDTKAMTATLVGMLVEHGMLRWDTTVAEVFPELASDFHPDFQGVTLAHLLSHRAGLAANPDYRRLAAAGDVGQQRIESVRMAFADKPTGPVGQTYLYSNWGYIIAGAMVERVTGTTWEQVLTDRVFRPLGMASAGFGGIGTPGLVDQPWGHGDTGQPVPGNGPEMDNPPVLGPAGRVHCTIQDWALYIADLLRGLRGEPALLAAQTCRVLVTPPFGGEYALGWIAVEREWAGGTALTHTGSNNMFIATVWMAPEKDFAVLVCANQGLSAMEAVDTVAGELIRMHG